jgi:hypothetical protein
LQALRGFHAIHILEDFFMAYKFQIGAAILSGSIKAEDGLVGTDVDDTTAANIVAQIDAGEIAIAKLAESTISGKALGTNLDALAVDDSSIEYSAGSAFNGSAASTIRVKASGVTNDMLAGSIANGKLANSAISGIALGSNLNSLSKATNGGVNFSSYNGSAAVSNLQLDLNDLAAATVNVGADSIAIYDADADVSGKESIADLMTAVAGDGLAASSGVLAVGVDDSSIELDSDALRIKATGVTNAMLAGSIANGKLVNSAITIAGASTSLGGSITAAAILNTDMGGNFSIGNQSSDSATFAGAVIVAGNLTVQGTTTTVDSTTINVSSSFTFEGAADDFETTLTLVDPAADRTVMLPDSDGVLAIFSPSLSDGELATALTAAPSEINLLDAIARGSILHGNSSGASALLAKGAANTVLSSDGTDISYSAVSNAMLAGSIADSKLNQIATAGKVALSAIELDGGTDIGGALVDGDLFMVDDGADGTMRKSAMSRLKTYIGNGTSAVASFGDADATLVVGVNFASANTSQARTLTLPASPSVGQSVKVKVAGVQSGAVTISRAGSQTIDGSLTAIVLESDSAAVELVYVASDDWRVF